ncbi:MAG: SDR family oxidoreductase [Rhodocyclaceae bacterium]|nr:MAG: SDR family oxidoreductase [Rhodocyclaceae bacterium]
MKIGITGADGLLGWHLRARIRAMLPNAECRIAGRAEFADSAALAAFACGLDALIHCAGINRGADADVLGINGGLAARLVAACESACAGGEMPHLLFANSTHHDRDSAYGQSKREVAAAFAALAQRLGGRFSDVILPNVFGEFGRPFHNSAVATFCHQITHGETPAVNPGGVMELVHAQAVAGQFLELIESGASGQTRVKGRTVLVEDLARQIAGLRADYLDLRILPAMTDSHDVALFNTFRSYLFPRHAELPLDLHTDARGTLFEAVRTYPGGQAFLSTSHPGVVRGNHFHTRKFERFLVCAGEAEIRFRKLFTTEVLTVRVSGRRPVIVDIPTFYTHSIENVGEGELMTLFWSNEIYDPSDSDTFPEKVGI